MEIEQSFSVAYPLDDVWASFHDTPGIVACLPGASLAAPPDNGQLKLTMTVKLGPIVANFAGDGEMTLDEAARRGSVSGGGVDRKSASRVKGVAAFALHALAPAETRVDVTVDYTIAGTLAQFSRGGIVKELATRMTEAFAQNLKAKLDTQSAQVAGGAAVDGEQAAVGAAAADGALEQSAAAVPHAERTMVEHATVGVRIDAPATLAADALSTSAATRAKAAGISPDTVAAPSAGNSAASDRALPRADAAQPDVAIADAAQPITAAQPAHVSAQSQMAAQPATAEPTRQQIMQSIAAAQSAPTSTPMPTPAPTTPAAAATQSATQSAPRASQPPAAPLPQNAPLDLGNLFWKMLWARVRGWLRLGANSR